MDDWSERFKSLLESDLGKEMVRALKEELHDNIVKDAQNADTQEKAFGLLKEASGVIKALEHLQFRSAVAPKGGRDNK